MGSVRPASNNKTSVHEVDGFLKQFEGKELVEFILAKVSLFHSSSQQANVSCSQGISGPLDQSLTRKLHRRMPRLRVILRDPMPQSQGHKQGKNKLLEIK